MPWDIIDQFDDKPTTFQLMAWCRHARDHYLNRYWPDLRRYIAWFGHNKFSPKDDFRTVLGSVAVNYRYSRYKIDMKIAIDNRYGFFYIDISSF